jgi:asparagine synthase (glutamine-hydrolysing)
VRLVELMDKAVERRLVADVPLGSFLSGGIDSSVVTALASRHVTQLNTFSVGYKHDAFYDETRYAELVAKKCNTRHTVFSLTQDDVFEHLDGILDYIDEPFADSSALPVYVLSKLTRQHVTVALSGDGADELFGGYMKHWAEYRVRHRNMTEEAVVAMEPVLSMMPRSRSGKIGNRLRQLNRFASGAKLSAKERYWRWCSIADERSAAKLLHTHIDPSLYHRRKTSLLKPIDGAKDLNDMLLADMTMVLPGDMLVKVDLMSMANSLEVRTPFLDYTVVNFAFSLPSDFKTDRSGRKKIVQDAFRKILPTELYNRPKKGFEVPLLEWMRTGLASRVKTLCLDEDRIYHQGIFNHDALVDLWKQVHSNSPEDSAARMWAVLVFQRWWDRYYIS